MFTQAGPRVGRNPGGDHFSSQVKLGFVWAGFLVLETKAHISVKYMSLFFMEMIRFFANETGSTDYLTIKH